MVPLYWRAAPAHPSEDFSPGSVVHDQVRYVALAYGGLF